MCDADKCQMRTPIHHRAASSLPIECTADDRKQQPDAAEKTASAARIGRAKTTRHYVTSLSAAGVEHAKVN